MDIAYFFLKLAKISYFVNKEIINNLFQLLK